VNNLKISVRFFWLTIGAGARQARSNASALRPLVALGVHDSTTGSVYVVTEGTFTMKSSTKATRAAAATSAIEKGKYSHALALPDCVVRMVKEGVANLDRVVWRDPPGEGGVRNHGLAARRVRN
jgi:hypothetical protein